MKARTDLGPGAAQRNQTRRVTLRTAPRVQTQLAIVFADLSEFVSFTEAHGDQAAADLMMVNLVTATPIVTCRGGRIVKHLGDGLLAWFPDPAQAVLASLELARASSDVLSMRVGAHWGDAIRCRSDLIGHSVNLTARLVDLARPGEVLVTTQLRQAASDVTGVTYGAPIERTVRGVSHGLRVSTVSLEEGT